MKNLKWNAVLKRNCDGRISASLKIKYKKTICKVIVPDIDAEGAEDNFEEQFNKTLKDAFGKKKGKKIAEQVMDELSEL